MQPPKQLESSKGITIFMVALFGLWALSYGAQVTNFIREKVTTTTYPQPSTDTGTGNEGLTPEQLAAYAVAISQGLSPADARKLAKELHPS